MPGLLGYFLLRRLMPNATFYTAMVANSKLLVILLLITSLVTGIMSHVPLAGVVPFPLGLAFEVTVFESHSQSAVDVPLSSPFVASLASRAPPLF